MSKSEIPLWMLPTLAANRLVEPSLPAFYGERRRRELEADRATVPLGGICPYWYEAGYRLNSL